MKNYFEFYSPVQIVSDENVIENRLFELAKKIGCKNMLVISGPVLNRLGITDFVINALERNEIKVACKWTSVPNESSLNTVQEICSEYRQNCCDSIVAVGGGSVLDTAKAVKLVLGHNKQDLNKLFGYNMSKIGTKIPFIAIPTTCGTGSETTKVAVICDEIRGAKEEILSDILLADIVVLDPKMLETLPKKAILLTVFDALSHAIEGYCCKGKNPFSTEYSRLAISLITQNLEDVLSDNPTPAGRIGMLKGATYAGVSFSNSMVGAVHAIAHSVGSVLGLSHDFAVATFLPYVLEYNVEQNIKEYAELFDLVFWGNYECINKDEMARQFPKRLKEIFDKYSSKIGGFLPLKECGLAKDRYDCIAKLALSDGAILTNPRYMEYNDIINILQRAEEDKL